MFSIRVRAAFLSRSHPKRWRSSESKHACGLQPCGSENDKCSYIPREPCLSKIDESAVEEPPLFDKELITHLERLSLVRFSDEEAVAHLRKAVKYANQLKLLDTTIYKNFYFHGVEPMETVVEDLACPLREDVVDQTVTKKEVLSNAAELIEDYFVTPPGNIPLEESDNLDLTKVNEWDWLAMDKKKRV